MKIDKIGKTKVSKKRINKTKGQFLEWTNRDMSRQMKKKEKDDNITDSTNSKRIK